MTSVRGSGLAVSEGINSLLAEPYYVLLTLRESEANFTVWFLYKLKSDIEP